MSARRDYYAGGKRVMIDGAPCKVASWVGELGNDAEYREATKPRTAFKAAYYEGGHRMIVDGVPVRLAGYVKGWAPWMRRAIGKGFDEVGLVCDPPDSERRRRVRWYYGDVRDEIELAGSLFNREPDRFERVAARKIGDALRTWGWHLKDQARHEMAEAA